MLTYPYTEQIVRDLHWVIHAPELLNHPLSLQYHISYNSKKFWAEHLRTLDSNPEPLEQFTIHLSGNRLGKYYEALYHYFLYHHPQLKLLEHSLKFYRQRQTVGEADFIVEQNRSNIHLEVAVKFYLKTRQKNLLEQFISPNSNDNFLNKFEKLIHKQLQITNTPEGQKKMQELNLLPINACLSVKGWLFYHPEDQQHAPLSLLHNQHLRGWWLHLEESESKLEDCTYLILPKTLWLSPALTHDPTHLLSKRELLQLLHEYIPYYRQGILIAKMIKKEESWMEAGRGFVVHDNWPKRADAKEVLPPKTA